MRKSLYILLILLAGCDIQKRHYRQGFHVTTHSKLGKPGDTRSPQLTASSARSVKQMPVFVPLPPPDSCDVLTFSDRTSVKVKIVEINDQEIKYYFCDDADKKMRTSRRRSVTSIVEAGKIQTRKAPEPVKENVPLTDSITTTKTDSVTAPGAPVKADTTASKRATCETIVFRDGTEKKVNILEITTTEVRFKNCGEDLPLFRKYKTEVFMIVHQNGQKEIFKEQPQADVYQAPPPTYEDTKPKVKQSTALATTALIFAYLGFFPLIFIGGGIAIILGLIYVNLAKKNPDKYTAEERARTAIRLGTFSILTSILFSLIF